MLAALTLFKVNSPSDDIHYENALSLVTGNSCKAFFFRELPTF